MKKLLDMFDGARLVCAYNGRAFDMQVLLPLYGGDEERWEAHCRKLMDPFTEVSKQENVTVWLKHVSACRLCSLFPRGAQPSHPTR